MSDSLIFVLDSGRVSLLSTHPSGAENLFGISPNLQAAIVSAFVSILIFGVGNHHKKYIDTKAKVDELSAKEPFLYHSFESLIESTKLQIVQFEDHIKPLRESNLPSVIKSPTSPDIDFDNVRTLQRMLVYETLFVNKMGQEEVKRENFDKLFSALGSILNIQGKFQLNVKEFVDELARVHPLIDDASIKLSTHHEYAMKNNGPDDREALKSIHAIRTSLGEDHNPFQIAEFIQKTQGIAKISAGHLFEKYYKLSSDYLFYFEDFKRAINSEIELFEGYSKRLNDAIADIQVCLKYFRSLKPRQVNWLRPRL